MVSGSNPGGNSPDGETIIKNVSGDIAVHEEMNIWGDFEDENTGDFSKYFVNSDGQLTVNNSDGVNSSNVSLQMGQGTSGGILGAKRDIDVSDSNKLVFHYKIDGTAKGTSQEKFRAILDGNVIFETSGGQGTEWRKVVETVSGLTGVKTLEFENENNSGTYMYAYVDRVRDIPIPARTINKNGSGGSNYV